MDIGWWLATGVVCLACAVLCTYYELRYRDARKEAINHNDLIKFYELQEQYLIDCYKAAKGYRNQMHRRAQRAEAERDKAIRYAALCRLIQVNTKHEPYFYLYSKTCRWWFPDRWIAKSKDKIVVDIVKRTKEHLDATTSTSTRTDQNNP